MDSSALPVSVMVRALPDPARSGQLVGQAQVVDTGELVMLRSLGDLSDLLQKLASGEPA